MAVVAGVACQKAKDGKWVWKTGLDLWEFRPWPVQGLWRNGVCFHMEAMDQGVKLVDDAVKFSLAFEAGRRFGVHQTVYESVN